MAASTESRAQPISAAGRPEESGAEPKATTGLVAQHPSHRIVQGKKGTADANIFQAQPDKARGNEGGLAVSKGNVSYFSLVRLDVSELPKEPITDAMVMLYLVSEHKDNPMKLIAHPLRQAWDEMTVTWNSSADGVKWNPLSSKADYENPTAVFQFHGLYDRGWVVLRGPKLTRLVNDWIAGRAPNYGLLLRPAHGAGAEATKGFAAKERLITPTHYPALVVSYDKPIIAEAYGYVSEADIIRAPLLQTLALLKDAAKSLDGPGQTRLQAINNAVESPSIVLPGRQRLLAEQIDTLRKEILARMNEETPIVAWVCGPWDTLHYDAMPGTQSVKLQARLLREEYHELAFAVTNTTDKLQAVKVELSEPDGSDAKEFPRDQITLRASYWIKAKSQGWNRGQGLDGFVDDPLPGLSSDKTFTLQPGRTRRLWLSIETHGVPDGVYPLIVRLTCQDKLVARVPVTLTVLPVALQRDPNVAVHTYAYLNRSSTRDNLDEAVNDLKSHYENTFIFEGPPGPKTDEDGHVIGPANWEQYRSFIRRMTDARELVFFWHEAEAPFFNAKLPWMSGAHKKSLKKWLNEFVSVLKAEGFDYDRFMMYPFDESYSNPVKGGRPELQALAEMADAIHEIDPKIRIFANPVTAHPKDDPYYEELRGKIDTWSLHKLLIDPGDHTSGWPYNFSAEDKRRVIDGFFRQEQAAGRPLWAFECDGRTKTKDVFDYYRRWSWQLWHLDITGIGLWSYNDVQGESSWNAKGDGAGGDFTMVYETRGAPADIPRTGEALIPSRRWQAWREGIEDYFMLQQIVKTDPAMKSDLKTFSQAILGDPFNGQRYALARETLLDLLIKGGE